MSEEIITYAQWSVSGHTVVCTHGVACDVHCCRCHSGFTFKGIEHIGSCEYQSTCSHTKEEDGAP